jgi:hypothetical protein
MNTKIRKRLTTVGATCVVAYGSWQAYVWWLRNEPLDRAALNVVSAFERGDVGTLSFYSFGGEKEGYAISDREFDSVLNQYVLPGLKSVKPGRSIPQWLAGGKQYVLVKFYSVDDREIKLIITTFHTRSGPKAFILSPGMLLEWQRRYGGKYVGEPLKVQRFGPMLDGVTRDRSQLEALGIKGIMDMPPGQGLFGWDAATLHFQIGMK